MRSEKEEFKPISIKPPNQSPILFQLRCLIDLQLATIVKALRPALTKLTGSVLDVGAGESPWRDWLPKTTNYQGIDIENASAFGMNQSRPDIIYYAGGTMPFNDQTFDNVLCIEVLEHALNPQFLIEEIARVLKPGGKLFLSVPWSARLHHLPHDYHRFTRERLRIILEESGFDHIKINERGNDIGAIANKLTVLTIRLISTWGGWILWRLPLGFFVGFIATIFIAAAHFSAALGMGSKQDPLGYFVQANRLNE